MEEPVYEHHIQDISYATEIRPDTAKTIYMMSNIEIRTLTSELVWTLVTIHALRYACGLRRRRRI